MNSPILFEGLGSAMALTGFVLAIRAVWKFLRLRFRRSSLKSAVERFLAGRTTVSVIRWLGVGNVGAVALVTLTPGWEDALGLVWKSMRPFASEVVVKVGRFSGGTRKRREILVELAKEIEARMGTADAVPLCPLLAVGFVADGLPGGNALIEVMPMVQGTSLKGVITAGELRNREHAIRELLNILRSVLFLESRGLFNRNVDTENVIVQPSGNWIRIDYDTISRVSELPVERMERLTRLTAAVLGAVARTPEDMTLLARMRQQFRTPPESWRLRGLPLSTEELIAELNALPGVS